MNDDIFQFAHDLGCCLVARGYRIATAESCTGGGIAAAITAIPGSSGWFEYGIVSYANAAKQKLLGVSPQTLAVDGAVSDAAVREMVTGLLTLSGSEIGIAVSGIAGPDGGTLQKPVGTVWFAWARLGEMVQTKQLQFSGDRCSIQEQAVAYALQGAISLVEKNTV